ncbi:TonB-dependent receptor domain-containing protein [Caulobacter sp. DWR1-3-2b1]|uniref:TonB-dependent receptor domain-containing protein n=1 Tax=Caulobacter sp. DWR1-3-2b1 TaxID=2804670 RepID=UPI003CF91158
MRFKLLLAATAMIMPTGVAMAQTPVAQAPASTAAPKPAAKPGEAATAVEGVTVTSDSTAMRTSIDRRSYSVANDLSARTGSISDALRNIPSVEVDVQGNVSLRGDPNVTIMIDGKPSGMFNGDGKADALQQLPADQIDRVEVMTNPSAAFRPDGSAGVINLITKKNAKPGTTGSIRANIGPDGRYNGGISGSRRAGKLTLSGDAGYRFDNQEFSQTVERAVFDTPSQTFVESRQAAKFENKGGGLNLRGGLDYDLDKQNRLSTEIRYRGFSFDTEGVETFEGENVAGAVNRAFRRATMADMSRKNAAITGDWRRQLKGAEHELAAHVEYELTDFSRDSRAFADNTPAADEYEVYGFGSDQTRANFKLDYTRSLPGESKLKAGVDLEAARNEYDNHGARGPTPGGLIVDANRTNRFLYDQNVYAAYLTYEKPFGDFTVQGGLRLEQVEIETSQVTANLKGQNDYFRAYPSLHMGYKLSETQTLSANYSHRVQRPQPQDLNPYPIYQDPQNYFAGNPNLKPQETHSYELGYQYRKGPASYLATAYFRQSYKAVTSVTRDLGGGVLLTTRENLGESRNGGLELVANGKLTPKITYNVSANAFWNEIDANALGFTGTRSGTTLSGRANVNWQVTPKDFLQINGFTSGKRLTPQGYREPHQMINLGYRRKMNDKLSFVVTANDVLNSFKDDSIIETPLLRDRTERRPKVRAVFFGFTYLFGGGKQREPGFDFGGAQVGG